MPSNTVLGRRQALKTLASLAGTPLYAQQSKAPAPSPAALHLKRNQPFDDNWRFLRADSPGAENPEFDDSSWRLLDLPHDFSVENLPPRRADSNGQDEVWGTAILPTRIGPFDTQLSAGGRDTGWLVGGTAWYRKHFSASALPIDAQLEIVFDGVYMNSDVWLNGNHLGNHPYGYTPFFYDLTSHLRRNAPNVLAVRIRNEGRNSRWYSGSGIYRHVWLNSTGPLRLPLWTVFVTTPEVSADHATVKVAFEIENRATHPHDASVRIRLLDPDGHAAATASSTHSLSAHSNIEHELDLTVSTPQLWSPAAPRLYRAEVELLAANSPADSTTVPFGIRKVEIDAERGLRINGEPHKLRGGCLHHDNGLLGACAIDRADQRRVELMKAHGFNAIRTAHNPPSPAFLDACDRLGMLVLEEAFDQWERPKNPQDYHLYFDEWSQRDIEAMVRRDRNHPSVILWSIGNEIPERAQPRGVELARSLRTHLRSFDSTRPITAAINGFQPGPALDPAFESLDVAGYNYLPNAYAPDHERHPQRIMLGTESFPRAAFQSWTPVQEHPYVIGDFVWTGMDHLGESSIGNAQLDNPHPATFGPPPKPAAPSPQTAPKQPTGSMADFFGGSTIFLPFPWFNCYCGDIDLIGQAKPQWLYRRVLWGLSKLEVAVQRPVPEGHKELISPWGWSDELSSWTWPGAEGNKINVRVYSTAARVQLLLNGKEIGTQPVSAGTGYKAEFELTYSPGELKAIALSTNNDKITELTLTTTGAPARLHLLADRPTILRSRNDLSFVTLEVHDSAGHLVPDAAVPVTFTLHGAAELAASGSANPKDVASFRSPKLTTYHGRALAILRPKLLPGPATLQAQSPGLTPATVLIRIT